MQKEIVTMENIKKDMRALLGKQVLAGVLVFPWLWIITLLIGAIFENCGRNVPFLVIHLVALAIVLLDTTLVILKLYQIKNERFYLVRDFVVDKIGEVPRVFKWVAYAPYRLVFAREGVQSVYRNMDFYKWTGCPRNNKTIFDTADLKDDFLLVQVGCRTWAMYNEKFFDTSAVYNVKE